MARAQAFAYTPGDRTEEIHHMSEVSACWLFPRQATRHTPKGNNTAVGQQGDTHVTVAAEGHRGKWLRQ
jgi:hypothetical protein